MAEPTPELTEVIQSWEVTKDATLDDEPEILSSLLSRLQYVEKHLSFHAERNKPLSNDIRAILRQVTIRITQVDAKLNAEDKKNHLNGHPPPPHGQPLQQQPALAPAQPGYPPLASPPHPAVVAVNQQFIVQSTGSRTPPVVAPMPPVADPVKRQQSTGSAASPQHTQAAPQQSRYTTYTTPATPPQNNVPQRVASNVNVNNPTNNNTATAQRVASNTNLGGSAAPIPTVAVANNAPVLNSNSNNPPASSPTTNNPSSPPSPATGPIGGAPLSPRASAANGLVIQVPPNNPATATYASTSATVVSVSSSSLSVSSSSSSSISSSVSSLSTTTTTTTDIKPPPSTAAVSGEEKTAAAPTATPTTTPAVKREEDPEKRFRYERTLRKALQGKVKLFTDLSTDKEVVVKHLRKDLVRRGVTETGSPIMENPRDEAKFLTQLSAFNDNKGHPHVMRLIDEYEDSTYLWYVLEFCNGGEFFDHVAKIGRLDEPTARKFFSQVMDGVKFIHGRSICHLDLSLENLLMHDGDVKICDFGLARHMLENGAMFEGVAANKPGKIGYMSPEIFGGQSFDGFQCDVYSCGVILFIMLTGVPPYQFPSRGDARFKLIYSGEIRHLLRRWNFYPGVLSENAVDLLAKMLCPPETRLTVAQIIAHPWMTSSS